jgi:hypothetical protein
VNPGAAITLRNMGADGIGTLTVSGNVTFDAFADLLAQLQSPGVGASDKLVVSGALNLLAGSSLTLSLVSGYAPALGDSFDILDWGSISGAFGTVNKPALPSGLQWDESQLYTTGTISIVPEPATWAMLLLAAMGLAIYWRRSR